MSNCALKSLHYECVLKISTKISILVLAGWLSPAVLAACPATQGINVESKVVGTTSNNKKIYFCKQEFPDQALLFAPSRTDLVNGGSQVIAKGNTLQTFPLANSIDLTGFNVGNLDFNSLSANYPNVDGQFDSPSLFNFYIKTNNNDDCSGQYPVIRNYLRNHPNVFQTIPASGTAASDISSTSSIAKISAAKLQSNIDPAKELTADIYFYHANAGLSGQYFTEPGNGIRDRYCWVGVGTRLQIQANSSVLKYSGGYRVSVGVLVN
ncbi:hypothetical protein [Psychrobacter pygoscelis]|uniref:hypothetical protein n=1 Tax=Psychrobacter pygoscelis TaxID=2488563 RepID=UPI001039C85C|nr:hypothetical protein [Psychrobacter pygoscelis]